VSNELRSVSYKLGVSSLFYGLFPGRNTSIDPDDAETLGSVDVCPGSIRLKHSLCSQFKFLRKNEERHVRLEGRDCDDWKCIDFGS